jgi:hypothetical protein
MGSRGEERCDLAAWVREQGEARFKKGSGEGGGRGRWWKRKVAETGGDEAGYLSSPIHGGYGTYEKIE